jgi:hypothetical protein
MFLLSYSFFPIQFYSYLDFSYLSVGMLYDIASQKNDSYMLPVDKQVFLRNYFKLGSNYETHFIFFIYAPDQYRCLCR